VFITSKIGNPVTRTTMKKKKKGMSGIQPEGKIHKSFTVTPRAAGVKEQRMSPEKK